MKKTSEQINEHFDQAFYRKANGRIGTIASYNPYENTASVIISSEQSNDVDEVLTNVPCPVTMGVQSVAPEPGRPCYVIFKNGSVTQPLILAFWNHRYSQFDYDRQTKALNSVPSFLMS